MNVIVSKSLQGVDVKGSDLDIGYLDMDEISIKGRIKEITFE